MNIVCLPVEKTVHRAWLRKTVAREAFEVRTFADLQNLDSSGEGLSQAEVKMTVFGMNGLER